MQKILREHLSIPAAWKGQEFQSNDSWIDVLTGEELAEINKAIGLLKKKKIDRQNLERNDFRVPTLEKRLKNIADELEVGRGFALIRGLPVQQYNAQELELIFWGLGKHLGTPISQNAKGELLAEVINRGSNYENDTNARGYLSQAALPWHCDFADVTALFCIRPAKENGGNMIASSVTVHNEIVSHHPEFLEILHKGFPWDLRGEGVTGELDEVTYHDIPVYSYYKGFLSCSFNGRRIRSARPKIGTELTKIEAAAVSSIYEIASRPEIQLYVDIQPGDIELLNNHTTLHSRSKYIDFEQLNERRLLLRLWLNLHNGRPLTSEFADRYNTGERSGVMPSEMGATHQKETLTLENH